MEAAVLKNEFMKNHGINEMHPLHSLILDECCETAIRMGNSDLGSLNTAVSVAFLTSFSGLRSVIEEGLKEYDRVKIVYRGSQFVFYDINDPALDSSGINFVRHEN